LKKHSNFVSQSNLKLKLVIMQLFKKRGWVYFPVHFAGWGILLFFIAVAIVFFITIGNQSHSASDNLISFLPYFTSLCVFYFFIAINTSNNKKIKQHEPINNNTKHVRNQSGINTYGGTLYFLAGYYISSWL